MGGVDFWVLAGIGLLGVAVLAVIAIRQDRFQKAYKAPHPMACEQSVRNQERLSAAEERLAGYDDAWAALNVLPQEALRQSLHLLRGGKIPG